MHPILMALAFAAVLALPAAALADGQACCERHTQTHADTCPMPCCKHGETTAVAMEPMDEGVTATPARQRAVVWFRDPVLVGPNFLMGKYVIEHDTDRQARGEPCTHIYALNDQRTPVVMFHCTHLDAQKGDRNLVKLQRRTDGILQLLSFQFAGEEAAHGYPAR
jgi:hypothetical protein